MCRGGLEDNAGKSKVMMSNGEEGLECEIRIDRMYLEHVSSLNTKGVFWMNQVQMRQSVVGRR